MKEFVEKLRRMERQIAKAKGSFLLFALFLRDDAPDLWDVLVSAPWIEANKGEALRYIVSRLQEVSTADELAKVSRIVVIERSQPALAAFQSAFHLEHGLAEVQSSIFFDLQIRHA